MATVIVLIVTVGAVILLRPLSTRLGNLLEAMTEERQDFTEKLLEERRSFGEKLVEGGKEG